VVATPEKRIVMQRGCSNGGGGRKREREGDERKRKLHGRLRSEGRNECGWSSSTLVKDKMRERGKGLLRVIKGPMGVKET